MKMTEAERIAWQRAYDAEQERRRIARTQPATPGNPVHPRGTGNVLRRGTFKR
jgi:hypothetical protein